MVVEEVVVEALQWDWVPRPSRLALSGHSQDDESPVRLNPRLINNGLIHEAIKNSGPHFSNT